MEQDISTARRVGAGVVADDSIEAERGFHRLAFEPTVEERPCRFGEEFQHIALLAERKLH